MKHLYIVLFVIGLLFIIVVCSCSKKDNVEKAGDFNFQSRDEIVVKTEDFLHDDIKERLEAINEDSTIPIVVNNEVENCDVAIFIDEDPCNLNENETDIYTKSISLEPLSFADNLGEKFSDLGMKIKMTSASNEQIYNVIKDYLTKSFSENPPATIHSTFVGDIMLGRWVNKRMDEYGYNYPFSQTKELFTDSDINLANLESPFSETGPYNQLGMVFRANPKGIDSLKNAGINIVNLANNHFGNAGRDGMNFTFEKLTENDISFFGAGKNQEESRKTLIKKINGIKFAFLGYSDSSVTPSSYAATENRPGLNLDSIEQMNIDVAEAKKQADYVIVSMHLGAEYLHEPNQDQIDFAHAAIDSGADFIYGHHPHVVESIDVYNNKPVFYSLGNFIFDQNMGKTEQGLVVKADLMYNKIIGLKLIPIIIENYAQAQIANSNISEQILNIIYNNSE